MNKQLEEAILEMKDEETTIILIEEYPVRRETTKKFIDLFDEDNVVTFHKSEIALENGSRLVVKEPVESVRGWKADKIFLRQPVDDEYRRAILGLVVANSGEIIELYDG